MILRYAEAFAFKFITKLTSIVANINHLSTST
jgi:hypothetical protein